MGLHDDPPPAEDPAHPGDPVRPEDPAYRERDWGDAGEGHGTDVEERSATGTGDASATEGRDASRAGRSRTTNMLPGRERRRFSLERLLVRLIATGGVIGIGVAIAAILGTQSVQTWIIGLSVSAVSMLLAAVLWSSRTL